MTSGRASRTSEAGSPGTMSMNASSTTIVRPGRRSASSAAAGASVPLGDAGLPTTTRSAASGTAPGAHREVVVGIALHARDGDPVCAQRRLGLREAGMHARGQSRAQGGGQHPERLRGAVARHDLLGRAPVQRRQRGDRRRLVRVRARVLLERAAQRLAQPGRRPAGEDVDGVVDVSGQHDRVAVEAQILAAGVVRRRGHGRRGQLERAAGDDEHDPRRDLGERLRRLAEQVQPVARQRVGRQQAGAGLLGDDDDRAGAARGDLRERRDSFADVAAAEHDAADPGAEPVDEQAAPAAREAGEVVAGDDRLPFRRPAQDVRGDPRRHRAVVWIGRGDVAHRQPALVRQALGERALARARRAEDERQAHVGSRDAAATSRRAACGNAAQWTCRYDACTPPATSPSGRTVPRAASSHAGAPSPRSLTPFVPRPPTWSTAE